MELPLATASIPRRRFHRSVFVAAGVYNIAWGLYSAFDPQWLFRFARMAPANHSQIFVALAMVVGLYGLLYLEVARSPERGWPIAAVGMAGKVLGPIGLTVLIVTGRWPLSSFVISVTNDVVWWIPFGLYLRDSWPLYRRSLADRTGPPKRGQIRTKRAPERADPTFGRT